MTVVPGAAWPTKSLAELGGKVTSGSRGWSSFYSDHGSLFVRITNLNRGNIHLDLKNPCFVKIGTSQNAEALRTRLAPGDLLISITADIGIIGYVDESVPTPAYINQHIARVRLDPTLADSRFVAYYLSSWEPQRRFVGSTDTGAKAGMNLATVAALTTVVPPIAEQTYIADVLADIDNLIAALKRQVAKKQAITRGMMQALLTGKTRLPGHSSEWVPLTVASKSIVKARIGWQGLKTDEYRESGTYRLVGGTEFADGSIDWDRTPFVEKWRFDQDQYIQLREGDVLLTKDGSIGKTAYVGSLPGPATLNSGVFVIRPLHGAYDPHFLYFMLRSRYFEDFLTRLSAGSTISHLYQRDLVTLALHVPPTLAEQRAIATALADAESEVTALRQRLDKTSSIRQGMMQQLLTGRIGGAPVEVNA